MAQLVGNRNGVFARPAGKALQHPSSADIQDITGYVVGFFRSKEFYRRCDVFRGGRAADRKPGIANPTRLAEREFFFVNVRWIDNVDRDSVRRHERWRCGTLT